MTIYEDMLNLKGTRNVKNTYYRNYNCMGYALDTYSWLCALLEGGEFDPFPLDEEDDKEEILASCVQYLLDTFALKQISRQQAYNTKSKVEVVAFRIGYADFHFMVRRKNGQWYHKMGATHIARIEKDTVFAPVWYNGYGDAYDSEIIFFEKVAEIA